MSGIHEYFSREKFYNYLVHIWCRYSPVSTFQGDGRHVRMKREKTSFLK